MTIKEENYIENIETNDTVEQTCISSRKWTLVNWCEIDKYAAKSYCAIHGESEEKNLGDITKVDEKNLEDFTMMTWGFPCTDISIAGSQRGFVDSSGDKTESGLYYDGMRILKEKRPLLSIVENVKNLAGNSFKSEFQTILNDFNSVGYNSYHALLNAKDYGVPQNRERLIMVSIRKDVDNGTFSFPSSLPLEKRLKDVLEEHVDRKYYLNKHITYLNNSVANRNVIPSVIQIGNCMPTKTRDNPNQGYFCE